MALPTGASQDLETNDRKTAERIAQEEGYQDIIDLLEEADNTSEEDRPPSFC